MNKKQRPKSDGGAPRSRSQKPKAKQPGAGGSDGIDRLRLLTESFDDVAIISMDKEGKVRDWNPGAEAIFEFKEEDIVGKSADAIFTPEDRASHVPELERATALRKGRASDERWHIRRDGSRFYASGVMVPLYRGAIHHGFAKIARDLTSSIEVESSRIELDMMKRLIEAQEAERQRIARDLHDQLGQQLTALRLKLASFKTAAGAPPAMTRAIEEIERLAKQIDDDISFLAWELRPTALDNLGLRSAVGNYVIEWSKNYGIPAEFHGGSPRGRRLVPEAEVNLYRIAQEALNNVLKHAKASAVTVVLEFKKDEAVLIIEDDGIGFNPGATAKRGKNGKGLGLVGMRERAALLGGTLEIESARSKGTTVIARVPAHVRKGTDKNAKSEKARDRQPSPPAFGEY